MTLQVDSEVLMSDQAPVRAAWALQDPLLTEYYDTEWGVPVTDEHGVFERLTLEAFQSGLSWLTILRKREHFRDAFVGFDVSAVSRFGDARVEALLANPGIIRNRAKIEATVNNAIAVIDLWDSGRSLSEVVWSFQPDRTPMPHTEADVASTSPESVALAAELKKLGFKFVGPTTAYALMTAIGIVDGHLVSSHRRGCSGLWNADGTRRRSID